MTTQTKETGTKEVGFITERFKAAVALVESFGSIVVKTALDHKNADDKLTMARLYRTQLKKDYEENLVVVEAKRIQTAKTKLDGDLENFVRNLKNGPMLVWEN